MRRFTKDIFKVAVFLKLQFLLPISTCFLPNFAVEHNEVKMLQCRMLLYIMSFSSICLSCCRGNGALKGIDYTVDRNANNETYGVYSAHLFSSGAQDIISKYTTQTV